MNTGHRTTGHRTSGRRTPDNVHQTLSRDTGHKKDTLELLSDSDHRPIRTSDAVLSPRSKDRFDHSTDVEFGPRLPNNQNSRHISPEDRGHRPLIPLHHANHGELSPASVLRQHRERPPSFSRSAHDRVSNQSSRHQQRSHSRSRVRYRSRSKSRSRDHGRLSRRDKHHVKKVSHKRKRSSSYSSYSSSLSSSSSSRERRKKKKSKRRHKSHRSGRKDYKKKNTRKRPRTPSHSSSSRSSSSSSTHSVEEERFSRVSHTRREVSQHRDRHSPELSVEIRSDENDFNDHSDSQSERDGSRQSRQPLKDEIADSEAIKFSSLVEEILKLLPEDKFPREPERDPSDCRPRSSIQMDQERAPRKSISLPQSSVVKTTIERIAKNLSKTPPVDNWCPSDKDVLSVAGLKFYKAHCEFFPTAEPAQLDRDASRLDLSLKGSCSFPVKSLESYEKYSRDILRTLSHADILSFAAYKSLRQKELDPKLLERTLDSLSVAIRDSIGVASLMAVGLQQARRDAAIHAAPKSLTDESKQSLRNVPITSSKLFGGEIDEIYKRNVQANRDKLVDNAVSQQSKSQQSANASGKRSAQPPKKKPAPQKTESSTTEVSKILPQSGRGGRRGSSFRGSSYRGRGAPSRGGASAPKKH